jgi:L-alanine-DL-glutamate epimerase-like enolase superfamily enzyme
MFGDSMKIKEISIEELKIPFKQVFSHASAARKMTEAVLVKAESEGGLIGYGEGCPRSYVTGENTQTANRFFAEKKTEIVNIINVDGIKKYVQVNDVFINKNPAAWCAIELALFDLLGKENNQSMESLLCVPELSGIFQYTAVLGFTELESYKKQLQQYAHTGFTDYKIKVSGELDKDKQKIDALRELEAETRVRLDANNLWEVAEQAIDYIKALDYPFFAIEEPLKANDYSGCRSICDALSMPVILDESFLRMEQFEHIVDIPENWIINLRISKMGGILRSLAIAEEANRLGIPIIIGAQVGETSILTRAALTVANAYRDILLAQEGAFGTHLLENDIVEQPIMFGKAGELKSNFLGNGLGLSI